jgi:hypothetical protein
MIRIRTKLENGSVSTMPFLGKWITMTHPRSSDNESVMAASLLDAGINHLRAVRQLKMQKLQRDLYAERMKDMPNVKS